MLKNIVTNIGPGPLIAAAFIGPGTVTLCTLAGVEFGYSLLWAMLLSIIATIVLQEMAARLGIITQKGLAEIIRTSIQQPLGRSLIILLILSAIVIGNAAYEAGNISGGVLGLETLAGKYNVAFGPISLNLWSLLIGLLAFVLLYIGNYKVIEKVLITMVILMSIAFLISAIIVKPSFSDVLKGVFVIQFPKNSLLIILGLIGTTVVPYNLFLHASLAKEKWRHATDLKFARKDTFIAVVLGGFVSICVMISAASIGHSEIFTSADLAKGLEPLFGSFAKHVLSIGLFAAGITSAITAPLAAAYVTTGCLGWKTHLKSKHFRMVWMAILVLGVVSSSLNIKSITIIKFAQIANGILLPVVVVLLLWIVNSQKILGDHKNSRWQNVLGFLILIISVLLSLVAMSKVFQITLF